MKITKEQVQEIIRRRRKGESAESLAQAFGIRAQSVNYHVKRAGPEKQGKRKYTKRAFTEIALQPPTTEASDVAIILVKPSSLRKVLEGLGYANS